MADYWLGGYPRDLGGGQIAVLCPHLRVGTARDGCNISLYEGERIPQMSDI